MSVTKGRLNWTQQEDNLIKQFREKTNANSWKKISKQLGKKIRGQSRHAKQCRQRYINYLKFTNEKQMASAWEHDQQRTLFLKYLEIGPKWVQMSQFLPNKSQNNIKNKFYGALRKMLRKMNKVEKQKRMKNKKELKYQALIKIIELCNPKNQNSFDKMGQKMDEFYQLRHDLLSLMINPIQDLHQDEVLKMAARIHAFNIDTRFIFRCRKKNKESQKNHLDETVQNDLKEATILKSSQNDGIQLDLLMDMEEDENKQFINSQRGNKYSECESPILMDCFNQEPQKLDFIGEMLIDQQKFPGELFF